MKYILENTYNMGQRTLSFLLSILLKKIEFRL